MAGLTPMEVKHAKAGHHADGKGLYLLVKPSGAKSWVLRVQVGGRRRDYGLRSLERHVRLIGDTKALTVFRRAEARIGKDGERIFAAAPGRTPDRAPLTQSRSRIGQAHYNGLLLQLDAARSRLKAKYPRLVAGDLLERP